MSETPQIVLSLPLLNGLTSIDACIHGGHKEKDSLQMNINRSVISIICKNLYEYIWVVMYALA
jgi:hypothetical protein